LPTSHLALSVLHCGMPRFCVVGAMHWVSMGLIQPYYIHL
jgi:hypothetical protein